MNENVLTIRRIFIAHPKSIAQDNLDALVELAKTTFEGRRVADGSSIGACITTGRQSAEEWMAAHKGLPFNWNGWIQHVVGNTTPFGHDPRFHYIVVAPGPIVGRVTADIVKNAIPRNPRGVLLLDGGEDLPPALRLRRVVGVSQVAGNNWKSGWCVQVA